MTSTIMNTIANDNKEVLEEPWLSNRPSYLKCECIIMGIENSNKHALYLSNGLGMNLSSQALCFGKK